MKTIDIGPEKRFYCDECEKFYEREECKFGFYWRKCPEGHMFPRKCRNIPELEKKVLESESDE
ncbi:MAG: hypothetical protein ABEK17_03730 [Candidatus Aenigmatarchaeota archaeon]